MGKKCKKCTIKGLTLEPKFQFTINNKSVGEYYHFKSCCCFEDLKISSSLFAWFLSGVFFALIIVVFYNNFMKVGQITAIEDIFESYVPWSDRSADFCKMMAGGLIYTENGQYYYTEKKTGCEEGKAN